MSRHSRTGVRRVLAVLITLAVGVLTGAVATSSPALAAPNFKAPFPCGQRWTYDHHSAEVRQALDFVRADGGVTAGTPQVATAAGVARRHSEPSGAGNYIVIDHGGGWTTYHFHLSAYSVPDGAYVQQGQQIGLTGSTGNSSGAHIHYEQLYNRAGQTIVINGVSLAPYPGQYHQKYLVSDNCGGSSTGGRYLA
ncbi:M23 family metallopeptidase, partial [Micromonospora sp. NPDC020750]|uniref:M23 family metallopeptidase n=1 Tax=unclassified Micromonospora TaxID=2617518 RepID=UPI0037898C5C